MEHSHSEPTAEPAAKKSSSLKRRLSQVFWLSFLVLSLAYAWYSFYAPSNEIAWAADYSEAKQLSAESGKPMIMFFTATWCSPCRIMKRTVWADEAVAEEVNERFIPLMLYADDAVAAELFTLYQVNATPVTIITDPEGTVLDYAVGKVDKPAFLELLAKQ